MKCNECKTILFYLFVILLIISLTINKRNKSELKQKDKEINRIEQNKSTIQKSFNLFFIDRAENYTPNKPKWKIELVNLG